MKEKKEWLDFLDSALLADGIVRMQPLEPHILLERKILRQIKLVLLKNDQESITSDALILIASWLCNQATGLPFIEPSINARAISPMLIENDYVRQDALAFTSPYSHSYIENSRLTRRFYGKDGKLLGEIANKKPLLPPRHYKKCTQLTKFITDHFANYFFSNMSAELFSSIVKKILARATHYKKYQDNRQFHKNYTNSFARLITECPRFIPTIINNREFVRLLIAAQVLTKQSLKFFANHPEERVYTKFINIVIEMPGNSSILDTSLLEAFCEPLQDEVLSSVLEKICTSIENTVTRCAFLGLKKVMVAKFMKNYLANKPEQIETLSLDASRGNFVLKNLLALKSPQTRLILQLLIGHARFDAVDIDLLIKIVQMDIIGEEPLDKFSTTTKFNNAQIKWRKGGLDSDKVFVFTKLCRNVNHPEFDKIVKINYENHTLFSELLSKAVKKQDNTLCCYVINSFIKTLQGNSQKLAINKTLAANKKLSAKQKLAARRELRGNQLKFAIIKAEIDNAVSPRWGYLLNIPKQQDNKPLISAVETLRELLKIPVRSAGNSVNNNVASFNLSGFLYSLFHKSTKHLPNRVDQTQIHTQSLQEA